MGRIGITPEFQTGTCDVCKAKGVDIRIIAEPESFRVAGVCKKCGETLTLGVCEILEKYGKRMKGATKRAPKKKKNV